MTDIKIKAISENKKPNERAAVGQTLAQTSPSNVDLSAIYTFLAGRTTRAWIDAAINNLPIIIQDHANCEKSGGNRNESDVSL